MTMIDLKPTIVARSDQQNADDYLGGPRTIRITRVALRDTAEQPIAIHFEGDDDKPYLPCKSMRRVMVHVWGDDGHAFLGRRLTLHRDPEVKFGGEAVGGIRISHMSEIERDVVVPIMVTRGKRKPYTVHPLPPEKGRPAIDLDAVMVAGREAAGRGSAALVEWWKGIGAPAQKAAKQGLDNELKPLAVKADTATTADPEDGADFGDMPGSQPIAGMKTGAQLLAEQAEASEDDSEAATPPEMDPLDWAASFTRALDGIDSDEEIEATLKSPVNKRRYADLKRTNEGVAAALDKAVVERRAAIRAGANG